MDLSMQKVVLMVLVSISMKLTFRVVFGILAFILILHELTYAMASYFLLLFLFNH
jgi:hypothetical protein